MLWVGELLISKIMDGDVLVLVRLYLEVALLGLDDVVLDDVAHLVAALQLGLVVAPRAALYLAPLDVLLRFALGCVGVVGDVGADLRLFADVVAHRPALLLHLAALLGLLPAEVALGRVLGVEGPQVVGVEGGALELSAIVSAALRFFVERAHGLHLLLLVRPLLACLPLHPEGTPLLLVGLLGQRRLGLGLLQLLGDLLLAGVAGTEGHIFVHGLHELDEFRDCLRALGVEVLALLHVAHLVVELDDEIGELLVVGRLVLVELDDPLLEDVEEGVDAVVVGLLLETSRKARVNRHISYSNHHPHTPCDSITTHTSVCVGAVVLIEGSVSAALILTCGIGELEHLYVLVEPVLVLLQRILNNHQPLQVGTLLLLQFLDLLSPGQ